MRGRASTAGWTNGTAGSGRSPVLALWGGRGPLNAWYDLLGIWRDWATDVSGHSLDCGHYLAEEAPEETFAALEAFFAA